LLPGFRKKWETHYTGMSQIDWQRTKAYGYEILTFPPSIWVNLKGRRPHGIVSPGAEYEELLRLLTDKLYQLRDPVTGKKLIPHVYRKTEIYSGPYLDQAPDLTLAWWGETPFLSKPSFVQNGTKSPVGYSGGEHLASGEWTGTHTMDGIMLLHGNPFRPGGWIEAAAIVDIAPTLLYLLGLTIPAEMDGRVLLEAFKEEYAAAHAVSTTNELGARMRFRETTYSIDETAKVAERLRALGYIE